MAAKKTTNQTKSTKTSNKRTNKKEEKKRSIVPFLLLLILLLLGLLAYAYRDKLQVLLTSGITYLNNRDKSDKENQSKKKHSDKDSDNLLQKTINNLEKKTTTTTTVRRAASTTTTTIRQKSTTTTTVKKFVPVTTTTTTVRPKPKATTTTSTTTTTTTTTTVRPAAATTTTVRSANAAKPVIRTRTSKVYFTKVTMDDAYIIGANREVQYTDSPLTATINKLLEGTNAVEDQKYIVTNIPDGTRLLSAKIVNKVAYLDFSSEFEENFYGKESTVSQLKQIVFTATEFDGVDAVQFLINGNKQDYLGGEGVLIGDPLRREDFQ